MAPVNRGRCGEGRAGPFPAVEHRGAVDGAGLGGGLEGGQARGRGLIDGSGEDAEGETESEDGEDLHRSG